MSRPFKPGIYRKHNSRFFFISYRDHNGSRVRRSSKKETEREAWQVLEEALAAASARRPETKPIVNGLALFLANHPMKPGTFRRYDGSRRRWKEYLDEHELSDFDHVTKKEIVGFVEQRRSCGVMDPTIRIDLAFLASVWNYLLDHPEWEEDMPPCPITKGIKKKVKDSKKRIRCASPDEEAAALAAAYDDMHRRAIIIAAETGLREQEQCQLRWPMVQWNQRQIVLAPDLVNLKDDDARVIPLSDRAYGVLRDTPRHLKTDLVFWYGEGQGFTFMSSFWFRIRRRAGIKNFRWHDWRHTFATNFLNNGGDLMALSKMLGHSSVVITERYGHLATRRLHEEMQKVDQRRAALSGKK